MLGDALTHARAFMYVLVRAVVGDACMCTCLRVCADVVRVFEC
jgi:hypothetical protein